MHVAFLGPTSLQLLRDELENAGSIPPGYECPLMAYLARALAAAGVQVTVITSCCDVPRATEWRGQRLRVIATPRRKHNLYFLDAYRSEVRAMSRIIRDLHPDVVHANWTYEFADAALRVGLPCLVTAHDSPWTVAKTFRLWHRTYRTLYSAYGVVPRIRNMSFVSPALQADCAQTLKLPARCWVVPNGVSADLLSPAPRQAVRSAQAPVFIATTGLNKLKNAATLLQAFARVRQHLPGARLRLFGGGTETGGEAHSWAQQQGVSSGVEFVGTVSHEAFLSAMEDDADMLVHPSLVESFCMTVLEGMAKGLPCIGGRDSGAVPWLLDEGRAGVTVDVRSAEALADAMTGLAQAPGLFAALSARGLARVREQFTLAAVAQKYLTVYEEIVRGGAGSTSPRCASEPAE